MNKNPVVLTGDHDTDMRRVSYLIFITTIAVMAIVVAVLYYIVPDPEVKQVLWILDLIYALILLVDFFLRLYYAPDRMYYLVHWGWLDLIGSIPGIPALRILRGYRVVINARAIFAVAPDDLVQESRSHLAESVLFITLILGLFVVTVGSVGIIMVEDDVVGSNIRTGYDAMWWSLVTISTVGYGDQYPVSNMGRFIGVFMILVGVGLFTTLTSYLASKFTGQGAQKQREEQISLARQNFENNRELLKRILALEEKIAGLTENDPEADGKD